MKLKVLPGGRTRSFHIGALRLVASSRDDAPFTVEAELREEDTWRVLAADTCWRPENEHQVRLLTGMIFDKPVLPGSVLCRGDRWSAVVCDLERDPPCDEAWVTQAVNDALRLACKRQLRAIALPLLGSLHGGLAWQTSLDLIVAAIRQVPKTGSLKKIWLQVTAGQTVSQSDITGCRTTYRS